MIDYRKEILNIMEETYKGRTTALIYKTPFQLLIATILSAQSTDTQVNKLTGPLFKKYPTPEELAKLSEEQLANEIKGCGLHKSKARNIVKTIEILIDKYQGEIPKEKEKLLELPGVGTKTANVILANAFGIPALAVDTHVFRVANRLSLADGKNPVEVEEQLMKIIPQEKWGQAHHWLIWHGREICKARNPMCKSCPVNYYCHAKNIVKINSKEEKNKT